MNINLDVLYSQLLLRECQLIVYMNAAVTQLKILKQFCSAFLEYIERNLRQSAMDIDRLLNLEVRIIITDFLSSVGCT